MTSRDDIARGLDAFYRSYYDVYRAVPIDGKWRVGDRGMARYNAELAYQLMAWQGEGRRVGRDEVEGFCANLANRIDRMENLDFASEARLDMSKIMNAISSMDFGTTSAPRGGDAAKTSHGRPNARLSCEGLVSTTYLSEREIDCLHKIFGNSAKSVDDGIVISLVRLNLAMPLTRRRADLVQRIGRDEALDEVRLFFLPKGRQGLFPKARISLCRFWRHFRLNEM